MNHIKAKVISFLAIHIISKGSYYLQRESHLNKHNAKNNEMGIPNLDPRWGIPTKSLKKRYIQLYYNADSQMLIDQIFGEITLLQGRNLRGREGGYGGCDTTQNTNNLDWQGESSGLAFWEK